MRKALPLLLLLATACASTGTGGSAILDPTGAEPLSGWSVLGQADFVYDAGTGVLSGEARDMPRNSFLVSDVTYADFELELDVRIEAGGNSGVQVRSHADWQADGGHGRLWGYQIEVDPSERSWSGGLYDEGRRAWLANLAENEPARQAFVVGEWNRYRIRCEGPRIRTWVNGVPAIDYTDSGPDLDLEGHIAFQVHGGQRASVAFRDVRLTEL